MTVVNRSQAQQRADDIRVFNEELVRLEASGILHLDGVQKSAITAHQQQLLNEFGQRFDIDKDSKAKQLSLGMRVVSFLGALALATSVFFLFYQFWGWFSTAVQLPILVGASLLTFAVAVIIAQRDSSGYFAKLAALVAFSCFVLNIAMLGQIFNISPSDKALLPWAAFALLLAYAFDMRLLLVAGLACLCAFVAARVGTWGGMYWLDFGSRPENFFPAAIALFFVPQWLDQKRFAGFAQTYRIVALLALFLPLLMLANWGASSYLPWATNLIEGFYQTLGFVSAGAIAYFGGRRQWPEVVNTAVVFFVIFLYTKMFDWWWSWMPKYIFFFIVGLTALLLLIIFKRLRAVGLMGSAQSQQGVVNE
jgi:Predicted membrane protein (DUF2157)